MTGSSQAGIYIWSKVLRRESEVAVCGGDDRNVRSDQCTQYPIAREQKLGCSKFFDPSRSRLEDWKNQFSGVIEHLSAAKLEAMSLLPRAEEHRLLKIRDRILVTQTADESVLRNIREAYPGRIILSYPPGLAFGTGDHATTTTCLRLITDYSLRRVKLDNPAWSFSGSRLAVAAYFRRRQKRWVRIRYWASILMRWR